MNESFSDEEWWSDAWIRHLETYLAAPPRAGHWIASQFQDDQKILEIAGGSCRDSRYLADIGYRAVGTDFDPRTLDYLKKRFPNSPLVMQREDAFSLSFADKSFDISFSNGFWICFTDDAKIYQLIKEQARVTSKFLVSLLHNKDNAKLVAMFNEKKSSDSLYDIRFFNRDEIARIVYASGIRYKALNFYKFGGQADMLYAKRIKRIPNVLAPLAKYWSPRLYNYQSWSETERIACVITL